MTEEQFMALGYRLESIYVRINNFNEEVRLDKMLFELAQHLYPENIVFWRVIFKKCLIKWNKNFFKKIRLLNYF